MYKFIDVGIKTRISTYKQHTHVYIQETYVYTEPEQVLTALI